MTIIQGNVLKHMALRKLTSEIVHLLRTNELTLEEAVAFSGASRTACHNAKVGHTWTAHLTPPAELKKQPKKFKAKPPSGKYKR